MEESVNIMVKPYSEEILNEYSHLRTQETPLEYFNGDELAASVWESKYARPFEKNPNDMHIRLAYEFARIESKYKNSISFEEIYESIKDFKYIIPQGSPMSGIGNSEQIVSLSNCFVIGNEKDEDSYGGILKLDQELVQLMKRRGGVGLDLSFVRPNGSVVKNSAKSSTGVVPFMERFSNSTREVAQGGRRGALMETISIIHPDSEDFIDAKTITGKVTGANVSIKVTDDFMKAALSENEESQMFLHRYPVEGDHSYSIEKNASDLWKKVIHNAWKSAEPGVLFWDTIIKESIPDCYADLGFKTVSTNPCGEITLCADDSCRLLLLNLYSYVENPFTPNAKFNFDLFEKKTRIAQRMMDDLVDMELEKVDSIIRKIKTDPESDGIKRTELELWQRIRNKAEQGRRTGLGITGEGDMLAAMNLTYGTKDANEFSEMVHRLLKLNAYYSSVQMAKERGAFPIYDTEREQNNPFIKRIKEEQPELYEEMAKYGRRNIALLTIAPAGTVSLMSQTTSGIEPAFMISYKRRKKVNPDTKDVKVDFVDEVGDSWQEYTVFHHKFLTYLEVNGYDIEEVKNMTQEEIDEIIKKSPYHNATSADVDWVNKVEMQGSIQKHVDHSISVTVNLPEDISEEMVAKVYEKGWKTGCKGVTVYREGSRSGVLISNKEESEEKTKEKIINEHFTDMNAPKRPKKLKCQIVTFNNNSEKWIAFIGLLDDRPYEIFTGKKEGFESIPNRITEGYIVRNKNNDVSRYDFVYEDKDGYNVTIEGLNRAFDKDYWNYAKMISGVLRHGMPINNVIDLIKSLNLDDDFISTWKNGVARALKRYIKDGVKADNACPNCSEDSLYFQEGCLTCTNCGYSQCN